MRANLNFLSPFFIKRNHGSCFMGWLLIDVEECCENAPFSS
uniref:Uncharacterized protein n=1 Tax=Rhizophora mucronata TaxID=61149 RepID=A0A2P2P806_RHIMU